MEQEAVIKWMRGRVYERGNMLDYAKAHGKSVAFISAVLAGRKPPPDWMLADLGIERETIYRKLEIDPIEEHLRARNRKDTLARAGIK